MSFRLISICPLTSSHVLEDEQNTCSNGTAEINAGHGHSVALLSTHPVSKCPRHPSVDRHQLGASSLGMCHFALVPFPCQARAQGSCLAPSWLSTAAQLRMLSPGRAPPAQSPRAVHHTAEQMSQQRNWHLAFSGKGGEQGVLAAGRTAGQIPKANTQGCYDTQGG